MLLGFLDKAIGGWPAALLFSAAGPSRWRSNYQRSEPLGVKPLWIGTSGARAIRDWAIRGRAIKGWDYWSSSHRRCNVNKKQGHFGKRKNDRLIGKKPPNPVGTEEENQGRKDLVVVQSFRINLCGQWCVELFHLQSTSRPMVCRIMTLHTQSILRPMVCRISFFAIHIMARIISGRPHLTASSPAKSPYYYFLPAWRIFVAPNRPVDSD